MEIVSHEAKQPRRIKNKIGKDIYRLLKYKKYCSSQSDKTECTECRKCDETFNL
jgi:hypothetical protein